MNPFLYLIISDLHGFFDEFMEMLAKTPKNVMIVLLGDIPDYGPKTKQLIEFLINNPQIKWIMGNHEHIMCNIYQNLVEGKKALYQPHIWIYMNGGAKTLKSYGLEVQYPDVGVDIANFRNYVKEVSKSRKATTEFLSLPEVIYSIEQIKQLPKDHIDHMSKLPLIFETDEFICSHAPVTQWNYPGIFDLDKMESNEFLLDNGCFWARNYPKRQRADKKFQVFGHMNVKNVLSFTPSNKNGIYTTASLEPKSYAACFDLAKEGFIVGMEWPSKLLHFIEIKDKI